MNVEKCMNVFQGGGVSEPVPEYSHGVVWCHTVIFIKRSMWV